jgi:putative endonuclease
MNDPRHTLGRRGERAVLARLRRDGYRILARNWRHPHLGELDIVARQDSEIVFVEVRTRQGARRRALDSALTSVDEAKQARLIALAQAFLAAHGLENAPWRIDVAAVACTGSTITVTILPDAVEW